MHPIDFNLQRIADFAFQGGRTREIESPTEHAKKKADGSHDQKRSSLLKLVNTNDVGWAKIQLHRTSRYVSKGEPHQFAQQMRRTCDLVAHDVICNDDVAHRVEKFNRQLEFLVEKFARIGRAGSAAAEINSLWRISLLLRPIKADRAGELRVQTSHRVT